MYNKFRGDRLFLNRENIKAMPSSLQILSDVWAFIVLLFHISYLWPWAIIKLFLSKTQKNVDGEIMFITGAGSGIGRGMAIKFAAHGVIVICTDINKESSDKTARTIKENGGKAYSYQLDVTDRQKVYVLAETIRSDIGDVTMLVNNAGIVTGRNLLDCPDELMIKTMEVNSISHFWTLKAFLGPMIKKNEGHIVTIASVAGFLPCPRLVDYVASKFAAVGLHESLQIELLEVADNIKTTAVCPWFIKTGMFEGTVSKSPISLPMLEPEDVVNQIVAGVLNNEQHLFLPPRLVGLVIFKAILPATLLRRVSDYFGVHEQMAGFKGRQSNKKD